MNNVPPPQDLDKEVQELKKKLEIIEAESEFWEEIDAEFQRKNKKGIKTKRANQYPNQVQLA